MILAVHLVDAPSSLKSLLSSTLGIAHATLLDLCERSFCLCLQGHACYSFPAGKAVLNKPGRAGSGLNLWWKQQI